MADDKQFSNVPDHLQAKMERCVQRVKADGKSKSSAIAICFESVVRGKDLMANNKQKAKRRKRRRAARALARAKEKQVEGETLSHDEQVALARANFNPEPKITAEAAAAEITEAIGGSVEPIEITQDIGDLMEFERDEKSIHLDEENSSHHSPTSFDELDEAREAAEEVTKVHEVLNDTQMLVSNVLFESEPDEVSGKLSSIADELRGRIANPPDRKETDKGILGNFKEKVLGGLEKAKLSRATINNLPDSSFAYIEAGGKKDKDGNTAPRSLRHFPIQDAAHVRNALSRAVQGIKKGGKSADNARRALPKIRSAAKKLGVGSEANKKASGFQVFKDKDGFRWFGWVSNKFRDRDWPAEPELGGQIITEEAHKEFVAWVDQDPKKRMPQLWPWHTLGGAHKERADWIDYTDGFLVMSGSLTEKEAELLTGLGEEYDLAMSHGLVRSDDHYDKERGLIQRYRTFEASYLPREYAANEWTDIITIAKEVAEMGFTSEKRAFLENVLGEEKVMELETDTEGRAKDLDDLGVEWKGLKEVLEQIDSGPAEEPEPETEDEEDPEPTPNPDKELGEMEGLSNFLENLTGTIAAQGKAIVTIGTAVQKLAKSEDEAIAKAIRPKVDLKETIPIWQRSASESKENLIETDDDDEPKDDEDKALIDSKPGTSTHWLSEVLGAEASESAPVPR